MKRFFTCLLVVLMGVGGAKNASAQTPEQNRWSTKASLGWFSYTDFVSILIVGFGQISTDEELDPSRDKAFMPLLDLSADVGYQMTDWLRIGGAVSVGHSNASRYTTSGATLLACSVTFTSLLFNTEFNYFSQPGFTFYADLGVGVGLGVARQWGKHFTTDSTQPSVVLTPAFDLYPLCFAWGNKLGGMVELGWGTKGIINAGAFLRF